MSKKLVAYFSASGTTAAVAKTLSEAAGADLYEIRPQIPYTRADLDWMNKKSRSSVEMNDKSFRPPLADRDAHVEDYDTVFLGFPIWWASIPMPVASFLEEYNFSIKTIIPFCSHGGGRFGQSLTAITKLVPDAVLGEGLAVSYSGGSGLSSDVTAWLEENNISVNEVFGGFFMKKQIGPGGSPWNHRP